MGTEIIVIFIPVPFIIWMYNILCIFRSKYRKRHICLLSLGAGSMISVSLHVYLSGSPLMQGILIGSFFYLPYYLFCWLILYVLGWLMSSSKLNESIT